MLRYGEQQELQPELKIYKTHREVDLQFLSRSYERVGSSSHSFEQGAVGSQGPGGTINLFYSAEEKLNGLRV